ncbi:glycosyltransferase [Pseudomonas sp.]|uniref:glycosyltransferase n=1 Tax=Pseudomonas sp. TaxID=306 RepID=UPI0028A9B07E|nr:glycosyltransferase [Pseudomonas sp.]
MKQPSDTKNQDSPPSEVNSLSYWDYRFSTDWEENHGREQSRFFSELAVELMPKWIVDYWKDNALSLCDWGCAQGDGTSSLAELLDLSKVTGVDFSPEAIEKAVQQYKAQEFLCIDFLEASCDQRWDIVFSSNTLEHFEQPWDILEKVTAYAKGFVVLLLPFREHERIKEHFYTFDYCNIPFSMDNWTLVHSRSVSTIERTPNYWPGEQILLVYLSHDLLSKFGNTLDNMEIETAVGKTMTHEIELLEQTRQALDELNKSRRELSDATEALNKAAQREQILHNQLADAVLSHARLKEQHSVVLNSHSWKMTSPLRFARRVAKHGLQVQDKHALKQVCKSTFHRLPLPASIKDLALNLYRKSKGHPVNLAPAAVAVAATEQHVAAPSIQPAAQLAGVPDYIFWGVIDWHFRHQRPQQLAQALAKAGRRVFYISVNLVDSAEDGFNIEQLDDDGRLFQINLYAKGAPVVYYNPAGVDTTNQLRGSIGRLLSWADSRAVVSVVQHAFWYETATVLPNSKVVYDCMDHHEGFGNVSEEMLAIEKALVLNSDLTITTSSWLDELVSKSTSRRALIRNAGEYSHFANRPTECFQDASGRKIIGYYGAIAEWFDVDLVEAMAIRFPEHLILLIGADTVNASAQLSQYKNVVFTGEKPYAELPGYLHAFDVCLLPFKVIPLTLATNPVKVYEYLSGGKPVVSVDLPEIRQFENLVHAAQGHAAFLEAVNQALENPGSEHDVLQRQAFAKNQTWQHRAEHLSTLIENTESQVPRISVVVVTYNNLELTKACLTSLDEHTGYSNFEIIVVDNASSDGSPDYLREWASKGGNRRLILNDDNRGFAAGNNQGLAIADGQYLVMLNNDTYVTPGWLSTLYRHLERDPTLGILGPVTNNIGNEAKIQIHYTDMEEMLRASNQYTRAHIGKTHKLHTAAFFCVMLPRSIYEQVGPLDEAFGKGFFEDDDYCRRIQQLGRSVACAEDVFIHHHLSASFNKMRSVDRQALFEQNRATYEAKWGPWIPHGYRSEEK